MASEQSDSEERPETSHEPRECMACRGTGRVISNLGGTASDVACPWCEGTGMRAEGIDAQARWREQAEAEQDGEPDGDDAGQDAAGGGAGAGRAAEPDGDDAGQAAAGGGAGAGQAAEPDGDDAGQAGPVS